MAHDGAVRRDLPSGTVTFLFTDVEGSTELLHDLGASDYERALVAQRRTAYSALILGELLGEEGDLVQARELIDEGRRRFIELGDDYYTLMANDCLAGVHEDLGDLEQARRLHEDNLSRARAQSNRRLISRALGQLALYAGDDGRVEEAVAMLEESVGILRDLDDRLGLADDFGRLARTLAVAGRADTAVRLVSCSEALYEETGRSVPSWTAKRNEETLAAVSAQLDEADFAAARTEGRSLTLDEAVALALES